MFCYKCGKQVPDESAFCLGCGTNLQNLQARASIKPETLPFSDEPDHRARRNLVYGVVFAVLVVGIGLMVIIKEANKPADEVTAAKRALLNPAPRVPVTRVVQETVSIVNGDLAVQAKGILYYKFSVTDEMAPLRVQGRFTAVGGLGNDIEAALISEDEFENWRNRHETKGFYFSGKKTTDCVDTVLTSAGSYYLCFDNRFSLMTPKTVQARIEGTYSRTVTE